VSTYDVVVVGARAAGAATARLLADAGLSVLLVDRGRYGTDTLSTHALMRGGVLQLHRWGLLEQVIAAGTPPVRQATFRYDGQVVVVPVKPSYGVDALYAPRRTVLDPILVDDAEAAGVEARFGVAVVDVERDRCGRVSGVVGRAREGGEFRAGARFVVGADGVRSSVAELVEAPVERAGTGTGGTTYGYWPDLDPAGYEWNFKPDAASGVIPTNDGLTCVFASATARRIGRGGPAPLLEILGETDPELAGRLVAGPRPAMRTFTGARPYLRRCWGPGWALVGDAGYFKDPLSAHGLTDALRDAELLARAIVSVVRDGAGEREALTGYQATRDGLSGAMFDVIDQIAGHQWTDHEIGGLLKRLNAAMSDEVDALAGLPDLAFARD
jgi:2-polyprenyl-6-methoxyphenol hydroxylase-like FAD-dependent oxidoreductase